MPHLPIFDGDISCFIENNMIYFKKMTWVPNSKRWEMEDHGKVPIPEGLTVDGAERVGDDHFITDISKNYDMKWGNRVVHLRAPETHHIVY